MGKLFGCSVFSLGCCCLRKKCRVLSPGLALSTWSVRREMKCISSLGHRPYNFTAVPFSPLVIISCSKQMAAVFVGVVHCLTNNQFLLIFPSFKLSRWSSCFRSVPVFIKILVACSLVAQQFNRVPKISSVLQFQFIYLLRGHNFIVSRVDPKFRLF